MSRAVLIGLACLVAASLAGAQERFVADGVAVNVGWTSAVKAATMPGEKESHDAHRHSRGVFHLLVALADASTGQPIRNATVTAIIDDPLDRVRRRPLKKSETAGFTDFSDYVEFGAIGRYRVDLEIVLENRSKPLHVRFYRNYDGTE